MSTPREPRIDLHCRQCGAPPGHWHDLVQGGIWNDDGTMVAGTCGAKEPDRVYRCTRPKGHTCQHASVKSNWPQDLK